MKDETLLSDDLIHMAISAIEDLLDHCDPSTDHYCGVWADVPDKLRAALQSDNSGQPVTVPDGWIPVSERLPENKPGCFEYIVFDSLNNRAHHDYWNVPDPGDDAFTPFWNHYGQYVTHWQPLPDAPKVKP